MRYFNTAGVGPGRIDLAIRWPYTTADGKRRLQQEAVELKVWRMPSGRPVRLLRA